MTGERTDSNPSLDNKQCPACGSSELQNILDDIDTVCFNCGYVIHDVEDPERHFPAQVETNEKSQDQGTTTVSWEDTYTVTNKTEQQLATALEILEKIADRLSLSSQARKRTAVIFGSVAEQNLTEGRTTERVIASVLLLGSRQVHQPRPQTIIAEQVNTKPESIDRLARLFKAELDIECCYCPPEEYLPYLCSELSATAKVEDQARNIINEAHQAGLVDGRSPPGIAAAAIYYSAACSATQRTVADLAGVSRETIRIRVKEFRERGIGR